MPHSRSCGVFFVCFLSLRLNVTRYFYAACVKIIKTPEKRLTETQRKGKIEE